MPHPLIQGSALRITLDCSCVFTLYPTTAFNRHALPPFFRDEYLFPCGYKTATSCKRTAPPTFSLQTVLPMFQATATTVPPFGFVSVMGKTTSFGANGLGSAAPGISARTTAQNFTAKRYTYTSQENFRVRASRKRQAKRKKLLAPPGMEPRPE